MARRSSPAESFKKMQARREAAAQNAAVQPPSPPPPSPEEVIETFVGGATALNPENEKKRRPPKKIGRPPRPQKLVRFSLALPDTLMQQLDVFSRQNGQPKRTVIEKALARYIAQEMDAKLRKNTGSK
jgi:hypothetical protein